MEFVSEFTQDVEVEDKTLRGNIVNLTVSLVRDWRKMNFIVQASERNGIIIFVHRHGEIRNKLINREYDCSLASIRSLSLTSTLSILLLFIKSYASDTSSLLQRLLVVLATKGLSKNQNSV